MADDSPTTEPRSRPAIMVAIIVLWASACALLLPRILALLPYAESLWARMALVGLCLCLLVIWFYVAYYLVMALVSAWAVERNLPRLPGSLPASPPPVAVLYPTRNDFSREAVDAILTLDYPHFHLFILDDGDADGPCKVEIDAFAGEHPAQVTVIRRPEKRGFKAGNINHALRSIADQFPYFAVCDADGILPSEMLSECVADLTAHPDAPFVQTRQVGHARQLERFARDLAPAVGLHFDACVRARSHHGFVMFYGHGAVLRTEAWRALGGLPEIVTEDLAFSMLARQRGWRGIYRPDIACREDVPPDFARLRRRSEKWIRGTADCLRRFGPRFYAARGVPLHEKLDMTVHATTHFMAVPMLLFILCIGFLLPSHFPEFEPGIGWKTTFGSGHSPVVRSDMEAGVGFSLDYPIPTVWSPAFSIAMLLTVITGFIPAVAKLWRSPLVLLRYLRTATFAYLGGMVAEGCALLAFLVTGKARFPNTHERANPAAPRRPTESISNHGAVVTLEGLAGLALGVLVAHSGNPWLAAPALALVLSPLVLHLSWERWPLRWLASVPLLALAATLLLHFVHRFRIWD